MFHLQFIKQITDVVSDKTIEQPTTDMVRETLIMSQGPVVSYRSFKHGKRAARSIAEPEFSKAAKSLQQDGFGNIVQFSVPRARGACKVFIKTKPQTLPSTSHFNRERLEVEFNKPMHADITVPMRNYLQINNHL